MRELLYSSNIFFLISRSLFRSFKDFFFKSTEGVELVEDELLELEELEEELLELEDLLLDELELDELLPDPEPFDCVEEERVELLEELVEEELFEDEDPLFW